MTESTDKILDLNPVTLDDLNYVWTSSGIPCFYADRPDIEDLIEALGFSIYYLICNVAEDRPVSNTSANVTKQAVVTDISTKIVKVVNNIIGRSVSEVEDHVLDLSIIRTSAVYNMPPIPKKIVEKLDEFFRLVEAQHGTEAIVLLTFDPTKNDSSGWGVLVPDQSNTAAHCKYDPDSIVDQKPDHVLIVGSVHSHPSMAAYASGTDHADQADFDGLHITYGWQKTVNNNATQYYIEMQMSGNSWTLKPEDVFENFIIQKDPDPDVVEWTGKVKKALPPQSRAGVLTATGPAQTFTPSQPLNQTLLQTNPKPGAYTTTGADKLVPNLPKIDTNERHIIVAEYDTSVATMVSSCYSCGYEITSADFEIGYCNICDIPMVSYLDDLKSIYADVYWYLSNRKIHERTAVYLWSKSKNDNQEYVSKIGYIEEGSTTFSPQSSSYSSAKTVNDFTHLSSKTDEDDDLFIDGFDSDLTVCCGQSIYAPDNCKCPRTIFLEDLVDFDNAHSEKDIYNWESKCAECVHYAGPGCLSYMNAIIDFFHEGKILSEEIRECDSFKSWDPYTATSSMSVSVRSYNGNIYH